MKIKNIIIHTLAIALALCFAASGGMNAADGSMLLNIDGTPPTGYSTNLPNPYGYDKNEEFPLVVKNELVLFQHGSSPYAGAQTSESSTALEEIVANHDSFELTAPMPAGEWLSVQSVAFDPTGCGRTDHVFYLGINKAEMDACAWVYDTLNNEISATVNISSMDWVSWSDLDALSSFNVFSAVAGDFNGDGKEGIALYVPGYAVDTYHNGVRLYQFKYDENKNHLSYTLSAENGNGLLHDAYMENIDRFLDEQGKNTAAAKLAVDLAVGDFNGDMIDDIAVLSYMRNLSGNVKLELCDPQLKIVYGKTGYNDDLILNNKADHTITIGKESDTEILNINPQFESYYGDSIFFPLGADVTAGDFDGDGDDDLVVNGLPYYAIKDADYGQVNNYQEAYTWLQQFRCEGDQVNELSCEFIAANEVTEASLAWYIGTNNGLPVKLNGVAVDINGGIRTDMYFLNGTLYDLSNGMKAVYTVPYFNDWITGRYFITSAVAGNFNHDAYGREQICFVLTHMSDSSCDYYMGYLSGTNYNDSETSLGTASGYTGNVNTTSFATGTATAGCTIAAADNDFDGIIGKYLGASYAYSDPEVIAVLQAAPYFGDISSAGSNWTEYFFTTTNGSSESGSQNVGASLGVDLAFPTGFFKDLNLTMEGTMSWTDSFTESYETSFGHGFVATAYDSVVVKRTPVFLYEFDIQKEDGTWKNDTAMTYMLPQAPIFESLSVEAYNEFSTEYNDMMSEAPADVVWNELHAIDTAKHHLEDNEGNPYAYNRTGWGQGMHQISQNPVALGKNSALGRVTWDESNSHEDSIEWTGGFTFGFNVQFGGDKFHMGPSGGLDYNKGWGSSTTTGSAVGADCAVNDIDGPGLLDAGMPQSVLDAYGFTWTFGRWEDHLYGEEGTMTPFIGYALENVASPSLAVDDLTAEAISHNTVELAWTMPDQYTSWPDIKGYYIYELDKHGVYHKISELLDATATSYTVTDLEVLTDYTFVITSVSGQGEVQESNWSNMADVTTLNYHYTLTYSSEDDLAAEIAAITNGMEYVSSGDVLEVDSVVMISASAKDEYSSILGIRIERNGQSYTVEPAFDKKSAQAWFLMTADTKVTILTDRLLAASTVDYTARYKDENGTIIGVLSAKVMEVPLLPGSHALVTAPVTFTATPASGYALSAWKVTSNGETTTIDAANLNPFTLELRKDNYMVEAVFAPLETVKNTVTVQQPTEGGTIVLTDENGEELTLNDVGAVSVVRNSIITVTLNPAPGYVLKNWTGDAAEQTELSFDIQVSEDISLGAVLVAPIKYALTYGITSAESTGTIYLDPAAESGSYFAPGTKVLFHLDAAEGYTLQAVAVTDIKGEQITTYDTYTDTADIIVTVSGNTDVKVTFGPVKSLTEVTSGDHTGTVSTTPFLGEGTAPAPGTEMTISATAAKGYRLDTITVVQDGEETIYTYDDPYVESTDQVITVESSDIRVKASFVPIVLTYQIDDNTVVTPFYDIALSQNYTQGDKIPFGTKINMLVSADPQYCRIGTITVTKGDDVTVYDYSDKRIFEIVLPLTMDASTHVDVTYLDTILNYSFQYYDANMEPQYQMNPECVVITDPILLYGHMLGETKVTARIIRSRKIISVIVKEGYDPDNIRTTVYDYSDQNLNEVTFTIPGDTHTEVEIRYTDLNNVCLCENYATINEDDWFHDAVVYCLEHWLMNGYSDTHFAQAEPATRAQVVTILWRMTGSPKSEGETPFTDVPSDTWYTDAVIWAYEQGITNGVTNTLFDPNAPVTREQMITFFYRYAVEQINGASVSGSYVDIGEFSDSDLVSDYAKEALEWAIKNRLIYGMDTGKLEPLASATRAQLATVLYRFHSSIHNK